MEERRLPLRDERATVRKLYPQIKIPTLNLYADEMADAVALIDGRITESLASRNAIVSKGQPIFVVVNESIPMKIKEADSAIMDALDMPVEGLIIGSMNIGQTAEIIFNNNDFQKVYHTSYESGKGL